LPSLRTGDRSAVYQDIFLILRGVRPGTVDRTARRALTPEQAAHPLFTETVDKFCQAEMEVVGKFKGQLVRYVTRLKNSLSKHERSPNGIENTA
jgi:hypothetical protein